MIVQIKTEISLLADNETDYLVDPEIRILKMHWVDKWQCKHLFMLFCNEVWEIVRALIRTV